MIAESIASLDEIDGKSPSIVNIIIEVDKMKEPDVDALFELTKNHLGNSPLLFHIHEDNGKGKNFYARRCHTVYGGLWRTGNIICSSNNP